MYHATLSLDTQLLTHRVPCVIATLSHQSHAFYPSNRLFRHLKQLFKLAHDNHLAGEKSLPTIKPSSQAPSLALPSRLGSKLPKTLNQALSRIVSKLTPLAHSQGQLPYVFFLA
jgi:hypothetical protein